MTAKRTKETKLVLPVLVGSKPHIVTAFERKDKGNSVWIRWWTPVKGRYDKRSLGFTARDAKGVIDQALVEKAHAMALEQYHVLVGISPPVTAKVAPPLTVAAGLDLATTIGTGMWPVPSQRSATFRLLVPRVLAMLPDHITWADLGPSHYEQLWRVPATAAAAAGHNRGREVARTFCILLSQSAVWLARNRKIGEKDGAAPDKWQDKLDDEWNRITKLTYMVNRPRHTQEQLGRIFGGLHLGDPRVALALELAGEGRLGQALRSRRSQLDLTVGPFGAFRVHGSGGKLGTYAFLTEEMRAAVDAAFAGYLSALEAKFRTDMASWESPDDSPERPDYPLFPAGRLVQGKAKIGTTDTLGDSAATAMFHELEKAVGVKPVRGRAWYGIRRVATDLAQDETTDGRALNALTGHSSDATRTKDYQEKERPEVLTLAAKTRRAVRQKAIDVARTAGNGGVS